LHFLDSSLISYWDCNAVLTWLIKFFSLLVVVGFLIEVLDFSTIATVYRSDSSIFVFHLLWQILRIHPIPQCCTFGNQFRPGINSVQFLEFRNWVKTEFRNWMESVPAPESIPPIPGIPELGRNWILSNSGITISYVTAYLLLLVIRPNFGMAFRELGQDGIGRNWMELDGIGRYWTELVGIGRNW
jgi:hypothetical protein